MLAGEAWIGFPVRPDEPEELYGASLRQCLAAWGLGTAEVIAIDSLTAQKRMVEAGFGLALLPESSADEELRAGTLCAMRITAKSITIPIVLIHRRRAYLSAASRALITELAAWPTRQAPPRRRARGRARAS